MPQMPAGFGQVAALHGTARPDHAIDDLLRDAANDRLLAVVVKRDRVAELERGPAGMPEPFDQGRPGPRPGGRERRVHTRAPAADHDHVVALVRHTDAFN